MASLTPKMSARLMRSVGGLKSASWKSSSGGAGASTGFAAQAPRRSAAITAALRMALKLYASGVFRPNALKARLRAGKRALGCWTVLGAPAVIEVLALCGFDYLLLDQEHGFGGPSALLHSLQAMAATPQCSSIVRVPSNDPNYLKRVLDAGVEGVMVPNVETAEDARAVVAACRYPPAGRRGSGGPPPPAATRPPAGAARRSVRRGRRTMASARPTIARQRPMSS